MSIRKLWPRSRPEKRKLQLRKLLRRNENRKREGSRLSSQPINGEPVEAIVGCSTPYQPCSVLRIMKVRPLAEFDSQSCTPSEAWLWSKLSQPELNTRSLTDGPAH